MKLIWKLKQDALFYALGLHDRLLDKQWREFFRRHEATVSCIAITTSFNVTQIFANAEFQGINIPVSSDAVRLLTVEAGAIMHSLGHHEVQIMSANHLLVKISRPP